MPSPRPRAKPEKKWRNNQRSEYVRMPSRLALLIVVDYVSIYVGRYFKDWSWVDIWEVRTILGYCVLAMSNVLCQVVPCILYCNRWAEMQPPTLEMSLLGNLGMPQSRWGVLVLAQLSIRTARSKQAAAQIRCFFTRSSGINLKKIIITGHKNSKIWAGLSWNMFGKQTGSFPKLDI